MVDATLVTVHGFWSSPATWDRLCAVWQADNELEGLNFHGFGYSTPKRPRFPFSRTRIPDFDDIAQMLATEYTTVLGQASSIAFVTHSQGGLVLQRFLAWMISEGRARELARIRTIVMLACPNGGSQYLASIRRAFGYGRHPQAADLEVLSKQVTITQRAVMANIVNASGVDDRQCRIPFHVYAAGSDAIVPAASAQAAFPGAGTLAGNHSTILDPVAPGNRTAEVVKHHLLNDLADRAPTHAQGAEPAVPDSPADQRKPGASFSGSQGIQVGDRNFQLNFFSSSPVIDETAAGDCSDRSGPSSVDRMDLLLATGSAAALPRLSQLADDILGATPTRYTMAGDAPYVARPEHDAAISALLAAAAPPYPFVIVWGDTKSGKSRTLAEALRAVFPRESRDPVVVVPKSGAALAELSRLGLAVHDEGFPALVVLDDLDAADLESLTPDVLDRVTSWAVIACTMTARRRSDVLKTGSEVGATARSAVEHRSQQYELPSDPPAGASKAEAERLYPGESFDGSIAETLVGGRELIGRYKASHDENPAGCAVLRAAIDCRRCGLSRPVTEAELRSLFPSYLRAVRVDIPATDDVFIRGVNWAAVPVASQVALLRRANPGQEPPAWTVLDHVVAADDGDGDQSPRQIPASTWADLIATISTEDAFSAGFAAYSRGVISAAISAFEKAAASADDDLAATATFSLGFLLDEQGDYDGARTAYQKVIDSAHSEYAPAAMVNLGALLARRGDAAGARAAYERAIDSGHPGQAPMAQVNLGLLLTDQGDANGARTAFQRAIDSGHPDNAPAGAVNLGNLLSQVGDADSARAAYQRGIDSGHPEHGPAAQIGLGTLLTAQGDAGGARTAFQQAIDSGHPDYALMAEVNLGTVLAHEGDTAGARDAYLHVISSGHPDNAPSAAFNLGNLLAVTGDIDGARDAYQQAIDSGHPDNAPLAAVNLGNLLRDHGDDQDAQAAYHLAINSGNPNQAGMASVGLGNLLRQQGDADGARAAYQAAIDNAPAHTAAAAAWNLAALLIDEGNIDGARAALMIAANSGDTRVAGEAQQALDSLS
jgi:tetratricopeptide (TPR) repeat protein